jgi:hypothetical protein
MNHFKKFKTNEIVFMSLALLLILFLIYVLNVKTVQAKETSIYLPTPWREWDWGREYGSYRYDDSRRRRAVGDTGGTSDWSVPKSSYPDTTVPYTRGSDWTNEGSGIFAGLTKGEVEEHFIAKAVHWPSTGGLAEVREYTPPPSGSQSQDDDAQAAAARADAAAAALRRQREQQVPASAAMRDYDRRRAAEARRPIVAVVDPLAGGY